MAKIRLTSPTFDASEKTVTHASFSDVTLAGIQLIVNVTDQEIIYNFADSAKGGTLSTDTLTLEHDTTSMSDTDELMILVEDGVATQAVTGTVTANLAAGTNNIGDVDILTIAAGDNNIGNVDVASIAAGDNNIGNVDVVTMPTVAVTQSGTWDEVGINDSGNSITIDGTVTASNTAGDIASGSADSGNPVKIGGKYNSTTPTFTDGQRGDIQISARGSIASTPFSLNSGAFVNYLADNADAIAVTTNQDRQPIIARNTVFNGTTWDRMSGDTTGINVKAIVGALPAGTNAIGKLAANSGVDIGDVDITSIAAGDNNIGNVDIVSGTITTVSTVTALGAGTTGPMKAEDVGHTTGDQGFPAWGVRVDTPNTASTNTDGDYTYIATNKLGSVRVAALEDDFAVAGSKHVKKYYTNAGAVTDGIVWSPAAGARWYVTDIFINVSAAATVTLEDDLAGGDSAVWKAELAANSGWSHHFGTPLFSGEDAADLLITTTAGNVYVTVTGYEI